MDESQPVEETAPAPSSDGAAEQGGLPSCDGCRHRKLKCSRDTPSCAKCSSLGIPCVYDMRKNKPGLKAGAIESLGKRIDALERALCERDPSSTFTNGDAPGSAPEDGPAADASTVASQPAQTRPQPDMLAPLHGSLATVAQVLSKLNDNITVLSQSITSSPRSAQTQESHDDSRPAKRTRLDPEQQGQPLLQNSHVQNASVPPANSNIISLQDIERELLSDDAVDALLDAYFLKLHPWIPMLHQATFRQRVHGTLPMYNGSGDRERLSIVLDAMIAGSLHLVDTNRLPSSLSGNHDQVQATIEQARRRVVIEATNGLSVENLQALVIVAFTDLGNGEPSSAWPIIGSLTRTVEFLQLNVEDDQRHDAPLSYFSPPSLPPPRTWIEEEERRRVFWNIFALDRTCSITTGWNVGLTADNVSRRLPMCGTNWNDQIQVQAPFFEIWDKAAAKISNSIAFLPAHYSSPGRANDGNNAAGGSSNGSGAGPDTNGHSTTENGTTQRTQRQQKASGPIDKSAIGAFAYYVESLEWLSRILTYFLQPKINFKNPEEVSNWLTRFKELDLDLVHWKMFLPPKWKDPSIPPPETANFLDPNMSLAHVTHNTSMILLHQRIGYPDTKQHALQRLQLRLPSDYSAETCQLAAIETAHITREYLASAPAAKSVSPHFAFCAFVSAKALLVHSQHYKTALDNRFDLLLTCIRQIASRWQGNKSHPYPTIATKLETELVALWSRCQEDPNFRLSVLGPIDSTHFSGVAGQSPAASHDTNRRPHGAHDPLSPNYISTNNNTYRIPHREASAAVSTPSTGQPAQSPYYVQANNVPGSTTAMMPGMSINSAQNSAHSVDSTNWMLQNNGHDGLSNILDSLTDASFMDLDRIISFDDTYPAVQPVPAGTMVPIPQTEGHDWAPGYN